MNTNNSVLCLTILSAVGLQAVSAAQPMPMAASPVAPLEMPGAPAQALDVIAFWEKAGPAMWFAKDAAFDSRFRERYAALHACAARGELSRWQQSPEGALALIILLDQYPRNAFRGTPRMYATDAMARRVADAAVIDGYLDLVPTALRTFLILPFGHSESLADQQRSVALAAKLGAVDLAHAEHHRDIVQRFKRFPHRNRLLGRPSTPEEQAYLANGGYQG